MMRLGKSPSDDEILTFVEVWIDDLARGDYDAAYGRTEHDPYYQWTPELMRAVIEGYGFPELRRDRTVFQVTERHSAIGKCHYRKVAREHIPATVLAEVWYDLPLNGAWSDLTATFRIERQVDDSVVILQEIHVF